MTGPRFLALTGDPHRLKQLLCRLVPAGKPPNRLNRSFDAPDLVIFTAPETPLIALRDGQGLLIGKLFARSGGMTRVRALGAAESDEAAASGGASLLRASWGPFAAFLRSGGRISVLRDPSATVPVHYADATGVTAYFSELPLARDLELDLTIDEEFLRQWLTFPFLRTCRTGIAAITELLPGTVRQTGPGSSSIAVIWSPSSAAATERRIMRFEDAAAQLRTTVLQTVSAQLRGEEGLALELSGGLDSSIVAASLAQAGLRLPAVNFRTRLPDGDERHYAEIVANKLGLTLEEVEEDRRPLDLSPPQEQTLRPPLSPVLQPLNRALWDHARQSGFRGFVTGAGGDNLFGYISSAAPILDAVADRGLLAAARSTLPDVAAMGGCTVWTAALYAARKRLTLARRPLWKRDDRFLALSALAEHRDPHPWLEPRIDAPPGKREHIASLVRAQYFIEPRYAPGEDLIHPLFNQPLMELCLAIPTWLCVRGGRNRAVARAAFENLLPPATLARSTKGRFESMCARAFEDNVRSLEALLLDGELAARKLVDRPAIAAYLNGDGPAPDEHYFRLFDLASLELWLRSWRR